MFLVVLPVRARLGLVLLLHIGWRFGCGDSGGRLSVFRGHFVVVKAVSYVRKHRKRDDARGWYQEPRGQGR